MLNKRIVKTVFMPLLVWAWVCLPWLPAVAAGHSTTELLDPAAYPSNGEAQMGPDRIVLAENKPAAEEDNAAGTTQEGQAEEKSATENANPPGKDKGKTKTLKTYVPTEKVKADQAVDFPYDI